MTRLAELRDQWAVDLGRVEDGYAEALENGTDPVQLARVEGMIAAYQQIIRDGR